MLTALLSFLASKGLTMIESGQLTAMATLPWTFKLFWGPIIDSFTYEDMGRRRPWVLFAQLGMALTLIAMIFMGDISGKRGKIMGMESDGSFQIIKAQVPQAELYHYATTVRSLTGGRGLHSESFSHYEKMPKESEQKVIKERKELEDG